MTIPIPIPIPMRGILSISPSRFHGKAVFDGLLTLRNLETSLILTLGHIWSFVGKARIYIIIGGIVNVTI